MAFTKASTGDDILIELHGRRCGIVGDGLSGSPSALVLDEKCIASNRMTVPFIAKVVTSLSAAGAVTVTNARIGDTVVSVTDLTTDADVSSSFEATITVANQIQQTASTTSHPVFVIVWPRS